MRMSDGKKIVDIFMSNLDEDFDLLDESFDFFGAYTPDGRFALDYDLDHDSFIVDDVDYCIEQAKEGSGGFGPQIGALVMQLPAI